MIKSIEEMVQRTNSLSNLSKKKTDKTTLKGVRISINMDLLERAKTLIRNSKITIQSFVDEAIRRKLENDGEQHISQKEEMKHVRFRVGKQLSDKITEITKKMELEKIRFSEKRFKNF